MCSPQTLRLTARLAAVSLTLIPLCVLMASHVARAQASPATPHQGLIIDDQPVHPLVLRAFTPSPGDDLNTITTLDLTAARQSQQYTQLPQDAQLRATWYYVMLERHIQGRGSFVYRHIGTMSNDIHVVLVAENRGVDAGTDYQLLFLQTATTQRLAIDDGRTPDTSRVAESPSTEAREVEARLSAIDDARPHADITVDDIPMPDTDLSDDTPHDAPRDVPVSDRATHTLLTCVAVQRIGDRFNGEVTLDENDTVHVQGIVRGQDEPIARTYRLAQH